MSPIKGVEVMQALRKGQPGVFITRDVRGEARIVGHAFGLGACTLSVAVKFACGRLKFEAA